MEDKRNKFKMTSRKSPIGVFDSGFGGLTILNEIRASLPEYNYLYLGDNARAPYGSHSFEIVYEYTLEAVEYLFSQGADLVILACNTASAKALRNIQQKILPVKYPNKRVLGVIRPSTEDIDQYTKSNKVGLFATEGTVKSESYLLEIHKFHPEIEVFQHACPLWVPLIEGNEYNTPGGIALIKADIEILLSQSKDIDTIILACTHYPIIEKILRENIPAHIRLVAQGKIIAEKLENYLFRHSEIEEKLAKENQLTVLTTDEASIFDEKTKQIFGKNYHAQTVQIERI